jgi:ABC-type uncharacterized transport system permease subunit
MIAIAHSLAVTCYLGAAALAAAPFARPVRAPVRTVAAVLSAGVAAHVGALLLVAREADSVPLTGLGPALSFAGLVLAATLLVIELVTRDVSLTLLAAPLAAVSTVAGSLTGLHPLVEPRGAQGAWLIAHVALSFLGIAGFATAAAAGALYLVERRELKSRRFGAVFRVFPPLETLDRLNHVAALAAFTGLTLGTALAFAYSFAYQSTDTLKLVWGVIAWLGVATLAVGRLLGHWRARRAAVMSSVTFVAVVLLYVAFRLALAESGQFL